MVVKKKLLNIIRQIKMLQKRKQRTSIRICQKKKKKQKKNTARIGIKK